MRLVLILFLAGLTGGCAGVRHRVLKQGADSTGIRYYASAPYLLVYKDAKGNYVWKLHYLPDQTRIMTAESHNYLAKITSNMTFSNGVLIEATADADSTVIAKAIVKSIGTLIAARAFDAGGDERSGDGPWLWRIEVKEGDITFRRINESDQPEVITNTKPSGKS